MDVSMHAPRWLGRGVVGGFGEACLRSRSRKKGRILVAQKKHEVRGSKKDKDLNMQA
ncbi:hypothetical protein DPF_1493 [Desulfoplanes formicivorans]|uniref:Uncharacterized protein n=1 Tax=Desulfoplanes formicivorans TaxID=1592317 RepID=A0A194AFD0_9BACT|nr:hypothetical protein DPF_1493 [Desulfoplanes formicivorans]